MRKRQKKQALNNLQIPFTSGEKAVAWISLLIAVLIMISTILIFPYLPDQLPTRFNLNSQADDTAGKASLFMIPALSLVLCLFMLKLCKMPKLYNYRARLSHDIAQQLYILARRLILCLNLVIGLLMAYIQLGTVLMAKKVVSGLSPFILLIFLVFILLPLFLYLKRSREILPLDVKYAMKGNHIR